MALPQVYHHCSLMSLFLLLVLGLLQAGHADASKPRPSCKVIPLKTRSVIRADTIFSGSVLSFFVRREPPHPGSSSRQKKKIPKMFGAKVIVKRVFRGDKERLQGKEVLIEGLGNPKICVSRPRLGDTRIFFTDKLKRRETAFPGSGIVKHLRLRSSLLRLTLPNLKMLWKMEKKNNQTLNGAGKKKTTFSSILSDKLLTIFCVFIHYLKFS